MVAIPPIPDTTGVVLGDRSTAGMRRERSFESARALNPGTAIQPPSSIHIEIREGDAATGEGKAAFFALWRRFEIRLFRKLSGELNLAGAATAAAAGVFDLDPMRFGEFEEVHCLVGFDAYIAFCETHAVTRLGELQ